MGSQFQVVQNGNDEFAYWKAKTGVEVTLAQPDTPRELWIWKGFTPGDDINGIAYLVSLWKKDSRESLTINSPSLKTSSRVRILIKISRLYILIFRLSELT